MTALGKRTASTEAGLLTLNIVGWEVLHAAAPAASEFGSATGKGKDDEGLRLVISAMAGYQLARDRAGVEMTECNF